MQRARFVAIKRLNRVPDSTAMDNFLRSFAPHQIAVDLGCGGGSFGYASYPCRIIGIDVALDPASLFRDDSRVEYIQSSAVEIPLANSSVDAVICNHTFEHFDYKEALTEIHRILKPTGVLWIAVPNGSSLDDALYRFVFHGGGHINRFQFNQLVQAVQSRTDLRLRQFNQLFSSFIYLKKPHPEQRIHFPSRARWLSYLPTWWNRATLLGLNWSTRQIDRLFGTRTSQYGWGFVFARGEVRLYPLPSFFNVCWNCGSGNDAGQLRATARISSFFGFSYYCCSNCEAKNSFFPPLNGLN